MFERTSVTALELEAERRREVLSGGASGSPQMAWAFDGGEAAIEPSMDGGAGHGLAGIGAIVVAWARALGLTTQRA